jgi:hypothetical protein
MRLSTRDLFVALAFVAVLAACAGQVGYANPLFWIALVTSGILARIFIAWSGKRDGRAIGLIAALALGAFCTLPLGSLATLLVAGALIVAGLLMLAKPEFSSRARVRTAMACVAGAFVVALSVGNAEVRKLRQLREVFPVVSLEERLAYEKPPSEAPPALAPAMDRQLLADEQHYDYYGNRDWGLKRLHDRQYEKFVRSTGFGVMRMAWPRMGTLEQTPLADIPFAAPASDAHDQQANYWRRHSRELPASPTAALHQISRYDFLDTESFGGIIAPRSQVAGFVPHAFHRHPSSELKEAPTWNIERIELVSLLKFDEPRVYVLDHLPRMDQLSGEEAPTRPLNEFETAALKRLRAEEDLVVRSEAGDCRMLGSLRAARQCLDCHNVQRGALLGAFSYHLSLSRGSSEDASVNVVDESELATDAAGE